MVRRRLLAQVCCKRYRLCGQDPGACKPAAQIFTLCRVLMTKSAEDSLKVQTDEEIVSAQQLLFVDEVAPAIISQTTNVTGRCCHAFHL